MPESDKAELTVFHRLARVLKYLTDAQDAGADAVRIDEAMKLLVGDLDRPTYVAVPVGELERLRAIERNLTDVAARFIPPASAYAEGWSNAAYYVRHGDLPEGAEEVR